MARPLRIQFPHAVYHVTSRGNERKPIVRDDDDRNRFIQTLAGMVEQYNVICHAWVLMDNHYHLLIETPDANLSRAIRHLNGLYTQAFNRRHNRVGHLFQGRFKAIVVEKEAYLMALCRYIVLNPIRARIVQQPGAWRWSSYRASAGEEPIPSWLHMDWLLAQFGTERNQATAAYVRYVNEGIPQGEDIWSRLRGQIYLGNSVFLEKLERLLKHEGSEIPQVQRRPAVPGLQTLMVQVARDYGEEADALIKPTRRPSEARQVLLYLARRVAGLELGVIAKQFGMSYTGVSRRVSYIARRREQEKSLRTRIDRILMPK